MGMIERIGTRYRKAARNFAGFALASITCLSPIPGLTHTGAHMIHYANDLTFESEILDSPVPTLVDFWAEWCGPCRAMAPALEEVANKRPDVKVLKVNVEEAPEVAAKYGVRGIPTLILFEAGKPVKTAVGAAPAAKIERML